MPQPPEHRNPSTWHPIESKRSLSKTLSVFRSGYGDPTTRLGERTFIRATTTPDGPATLLLTWSTDPADVDESGLDATAWGPGADWILARVPDMTGLDDSAVEFIDPHPVVERSLNLTRATRIGSSGDLYHQLLPTIIAQRITAGEAVRQWQSLCEELGETAPGPAEIVNGLRLPPAPAALHKRPAWWFHPLGIEKKRVTPLTEVARHADKLWAWAELPVADAAAKLSLLPGVGPWTIGSVMGPCLGDADAIPVGDFHFPNAIAWALAKEPRADDPRMLELLEPYVGQRGRVLWSVLNTEGKAPKFGPRKRILPMANY